MQLGIDFGTNSSRAALFLEGRLEPIKDPLKHGYTFPSSAYLTERGELLVGHSAESQRRRDPSRYRREFKRELGRREPFLMGDQTRRPEDLVAAILHKIKVEVDRMVPSRETSLTTVLTVPATYEEFKLGLMRQAAEMAGLKAPWLVKEPEAAAFYYAERGSGRHDLADGAVVLVYDLGGGTFDAAIVRKEGADFPLICPPMGDSRCGGLDFDRAIFADLIGRCRPELREMLLPGRDDIDAMRARRFMAEFCRDVKHALSEAEEFDDILEAPAVPTGEYRLTRSAFQAMILPALDRTTAICRRLVQDAGIGWEQVSGVLMVGGSCRIPHVGEHLEKELGRPVWRVDDPEMAVCLGAALVGVAEEPSSKSSGPPVLPGAEAHRPNGLAAGPPPVTPAPIPSPDLDDEELVEEDLDHGDWGEEDLDDQDRDEEIPPTPVPAPEAETPPAPVVRPPRATPVPDGDSWKLEDGHYLDSEATFSSDGRMVLAETKTAVLTVWEAETGWRLHDLEGDKITSLATSTDGRRALVGGHGSLLLWDLDEGRLLHRLVGHSRSVELVGFSPDNRRALSYGQGEGVRYWDLEAGRELFRLNLQGAEGSVKQLIFSPDGRRASIVIGGTGPVGSWDDSDDDAGEVAGPGVATGLILYDLEAGRISRKLDVEGWSIDCDLLTEFPAFSSIDGRMVTSCDDGKSLQVRDCATGQLLHRLEMKWLDEDEHTNPDFTCLAFSPDGKRLLSGTKSGVIMVWDVQTGRALHVLGRHTPADRELFPGEDPGCEIRDLKYSSDGRSALSLDQYGRLAMWDLTGVRGFGLGLVAREAEDKAIIRVPPGSHMLDSITLTRDISIVGDGPADDIMIALFGDFPGISIRSGRVTIKGLTLIGAASKASKSKDAAICADRGRLTLESCTIGLDRGDAISVLGEGAALDMMRCSVHAAGRGVDVSQGAVARLEDCEFAEIATSGVHVRSGGSVSIAGCRFQGTGGTAIGFVEGATGQVGDSEIRGGKVGIAIGGGADPAISKCRIGGGLEHGVVIEAGGKGRLSDCQITGASKEAALVEAGGDVAFDRCEIREAKAAGISIRSGGLARIAGCAILKNGPFGIEVREGGICQVEDSEIRDNRGDGLLIRKGGTAHVLRCRIGGNSVGVTALGDSEGSIEACDLGGNSEASLRVGRGHHLALAGNSNEDLREFLAGDLLRHTIAKRSVAQVHLSRDGEFVAVFLQPGAGTSHFSLHLFDYVKGQVDKHDPVYVLSTPDRFAFSGADLVQAFDLTGTNQVRIHRFGWMAPDLLEFKRPHIAGVRDAFCVTPDGRRLIAATFASKGMIRDQFIARFAPSIHTWELKGQSLVGTAEAQDDGSSQQYTAAACSPDGSTLVVGRSDGSMSAWNPSTGRSRWAVGPGRGIGGIAGVEFSPDGTILAAFSWEPGPALTFHDARNGSVLRSTQFEAAGLNIVRPSGAEASQSGAKLIFSADGRRVATMVQDSGSVWEVEGGSLAWKRKFPKTSAGAMTFLADRQIFAVYQDGDVRMWSQP